MEAVGAEAGGTATIVAPYPEKEIDPWDTNADELPVEGGTSESEPVM
ncbi:MAG: hypothetical protein H0X14_11685, partial [Acidobacteria bacterium]|nr:hypothetical protein [Acidobacteriota bacterium]